MAVNVRRGPIVVGVDGSAASLAALRWSVEEAGRFGQEVIAVRAWSVPETFGPAGARLLLERDDVNRALRLETDEAIASLADSSAAVRRVVAEAPPAAALSEEARRTSASMLVVGEPTHSDVASLFLGSVCHALVHHAPCPVVVVPRPRDTAERR